MLNQNHEIKTKFEPTDNKLESMNEIILKFSSAEF